VANHGANLQALATKLAFEKKGCEVEFVNYRDQHREDRFENVIDSHQRELHREFVSQYLTEGARLNSTSELIDYVENNFDIVVVGSDAMFLLETIYDPFMLMRIMRRRSLSGVDRELPLFWLPWDKSSKSPIRVSLSVSSMGTFFHTIAGSLRSNIKKSLNNFDFLGARDPWTIHMLKFFGGLSVERYPDPIFSLKYNFDFKKIEVCGDYSNTIFVCGPFRKKWLQEFVNIAHQNGYKVIGMRIPENIYIYDCTDDNFTESIGPLEWYKLLSMSAGYVGVRFHALASCISQHTPVVNVDTHIRSVFLKNSSKMFDLCDQAFEGKNFYTLSGLHKTRPSKVYEILFSEDALRSGSSYEKDAAIHFEKQVEKIIELVAL
jgi:hypothetical protein